MYRTTFFQFMRTCSMCGQYACDLTTLAHLDAFTGVFVQFRVVLLLIRVVKVARQSLDGC